MTMPAWPELLNELAERGSWSFKTKPQAARTDFDRGPARVRRRFTTQVSETSFTMNLSSVEFEVFKAFVEDDLLGGTKWFTMPVFMGGGYAFGAVRFKNSEEPFTASDGGFDRVKVAMELELRGTGRLLDAGVIDMLGADTVPSQLHELVNDDYPAIY